METIGNQSLIDFIGIGNGRSGSTWISECLAQHPDVLFSSEKSRKELKFFCVASNWSNYEKGIDWYLKQFPPYQEGKVRGEFCPSYLHDKKSHLKIKEHFPGVKIIAVLRNPIDWIYASYQWCRTAVYYGPTPESFEEALKLSQFGNSFLEGGFYFKLLSKYFDAFPAKNIHIIIFDDIKINPQKVAMDLFSFLGVGEDFTPTILNEQVNKSKVVKSNFLHALAHKFLKFAEKNWKSLFIFVNNSDFLHDVYNKFNIADKEYAAVSPKTREWLRDYYREDIHALEKLIGKDLSSWLK